MQEEARTNEADYEIWSPGDLGVENGKRATHINVFKVREVRSETLVIANPAVFGDSTGAGDGYDIETREIEKSRVRKL